MSNYSSSLTNHQRINFSLTDNAQRMKYQRISIKVNNRTNNNNTNTNNINTNINNISSPTNRNINNYYANLNKVRISHKPYGIIQAYSTMTSSGKRSYKR